MGVMVRGERIRHVSEVGSLNQWMAVTRLQWDVSRVGWTDCSEKS